VPKRWPIPRKGSVYVVRPNFSLNNGIPILVVLRDVLKIAQNKKEVKRAIHLREILIDGRAVTDEKRAVTLFDVITIIPSKKHYIVELSKNRKFDVREIKESEANTKVSKIIGKKIMKGKKVQINLNDGNNILSDAKYSINDSVVINLKNKKIEKHLPLKEHANVMIFDGKHAGQRGIIKKIDSEHKTVELDIEGKKVSALIKQIIVTE
jgi:small subunit ribosomal protein S4e